MSRFGLALALLIAVYAALLYAPLFFKAADYLRGHRANRDILVSANNLKSLSHARSIAMKEQQRAA